MEAYEGVVDLLHPVSLSGVGSLPSVFTEGGGSFFLFSHFLFGAAVILSGPFRFEAFEDGFGSQSILGRIDGVFS